LTRSFVYQVLQPLIIDNPISFLTADSNKAVTRSRKNIQKYTGKIKIIPIRFCQPFSLFLSQSDESVPSLKIFKDPITIVFQPAFKSSSSSIDKKSFSE
jgi:hypothetical protein